MPDLNTRQRFTATYYYPGAFMPETTSRSLERPTWDAVMAAAPAAEDGYFCRDGWYAVEVTVITEKRYTEAGGDQEKWLTESTHVATKAIVGESIHYSDIPRDTDAGPGRNDILISNIKGNSKTGHGIKTRCGNWQIADDWSTVVDPAKAVTR